MLVNKSISTQLWVLFCWLSPIAVPLAQAADVNANEIVANSEDRYIGKTLQADSTMIMTNADGKERVRKMVMIRKNFGDNFKDQKAIYFFKYPEDIKNTSYLSYDWIEEGKDDDA